MKVITFFKKPALNHPILIAGFDGWPNAGGISSDTVNFLKNELEAKKFAEVNPDFFHQYTKNRPYAKIEDGELRYLLFSPYEFFYKKSAGSSDLVLFWGKEPELRWKQFTRSFLNLANSFQVKLLITIGGIYDYVTHRQAPRISGIFNNSEIKTKCSNLGMKLVHYEGTISIHTLLLREAEKIGIKAISIWGHAPQYLANNNFLITYQIISYLKEIIGFEIDLTELKLKAEELLRQIDQVIKKNPELSQYIEKIEKGSHLKREFASSCEKVIRIDEFLKKDSNYKE
ncbi:MAG: PAC2 family protein [Desulfobacterota bacterium]|nr:PAC2 family protein [Thermodesulfobacteriota bacterium]